MILEIRAVFAQGIKNAQVVFYIISEVRSNLVVDSFQLNSEFWDPSHLLQGNKNAQVVFNIILLGPSNSVLDIFSARQCFF